MAASTNVEHLSSIAQSQAVRNAVPQLSGNIVSISGTISTSPDASELSPTSLVLDIQGVDHLHISFPCDEEIACSILDECDDIELPLGQRGVSVTRNEYFSILPSTEFTTSFNVAEYSIIDHISRFWRGPNDTTAPIRAELEALHVYRSGCAGIIIGANEPETYDHVGTLLISLPSECGAFTLAVRKYSEPSPTEELTVDALEPHSIRWFAVPAMSTYEVRGPEKHFCFFLVYQLFQAHSTADAPSSVNFHEMKPYKDLLSLFSMPAFMAQGAEIGFNCKGHYNRLTLARADVENDLGAILQGIDLQMYQIFRMLGLEPDLKPIFEIPTGVRKIANSRPSAENNDGNPAYIVGNSLSSWKVGYEYSFACMRDPPVQTDPPARIVYDIYWVNHRGDAEPSHLQPDFKVEYWPGGLQIAKLKKSDYFMPSAWGSRLAIIAKVPPYSERQIVTS